MNLLDLRKFTFELSVINLIVLPFSIPFFIPKKFFGFIRFRLFLNTSLKIVNLTLSPLFLNFPFSFASENSMFPSKFTLSIFTFLFFSTAISSLMLLAIIESATCLISTSVLKNPFLL